MQKTIIGFTLLAAMGLSSGVYASALADQVELVLGPAYDKARSQLELSDPQKQAIKSTAVKYEADIKMAQNKMKQSRTGIEEEFAKENPDKTKIDQFADDLMKAKGEKLKLNLSKRLEIHKILTTKQRAKRDELIKHVNENHVED